MVAFLFQQQKALCHFSLLVHRLCTRAGMLESFLVCPGELTDDQVMELLKISFRQPEVVLALAKMVHDVHERSNVQNPLE